MEDEVFVSGYCRQIDGHRTVTAELTDGVLDCVDCCYPDCVHKPNCTIAKEIDRKLQ